MLSFDVPRKYIAAKNLQQNKLSDRLIQASNRTAATSRLDAQNRQRPEKTPYMLHGKRELP